MSDPIVIKGTKGAHYTITPALRAQGLDAALEQAWFQFRRQMVTMMEHAPEDASVQMLGYIEDTDE